MNKQTLSYVDDKGNIFLIRGDTFAIKFKRVFIDDTTIVDKSQKMWFTIKLNPYTDKIILQKTIDDDIEFTDEDYYYHIVLEHDDTKDLYYGEYYYDIQVENNGVVTTIKKAKIKLLEEITFEGGDE